ncbi:hypothetical protein GCM10027036_09700 [Flavihumibacter cheonanensis]|uniref:hypothetical protein n=1 Tax=Flavihumibacter cheonanensis TaxID=1442385 RepID=UPI001EF910E1|nr:hypothetical protein [Flavihumibacter cheonanensis]MCG7751590.1 hypothetical protein [Flavihumibacter cheonanensis]
MFRSWLLLPGLVLLVLDANSQTGYQFPSEKYKVIDSIPIYFRPGQWGNLSLLDSDPGKLKPVEMPMVKIPETVTYFIPNSWRKGWVQPYIPNSIPVVPTERK